MKILITGGTGFVGKTLIPELYNSGYTDICLLVRNVTKANRLFAGVRLSIIDSNDTVWRKNIIAYNPDVVIHLATCPNHHNDALSVQQVVETNLLFTSLVAEAVSQTDCKYFINTGTFTEFFTGDVESKHDTRTEYYPNNFYSASKTATRALLNFWQKVGKWKWINVIPYSPYGRFNETTKVFDLIYRSISSKDPIKLSEGKQILDFIHVDDITRFYIVLLNHLQDITDDYTQLYLGSGIGHSLRDVASSMEKITKKKVKIEWGALAYRPMDTMYAVAPIGKNPSWFFWRAKIGIEEGIRIYIDDVAGR